MHCSCYESRWRQIGALCYPVPSHGTWVEDRERELYFPNNDLTVVILGAGRTGLKIAAQLKYLAVRTLVIDNKSCRRYGKSCRLPTTTFGRGKKKVDIRG